MTDREIFEKSCQLNSQIQFEYCEKLRQEEEKNHVRNSTFNSNNSDNIFPISTT